MDGSFASGFFVSATLCRPSPSPSVGKQTDGSDAEEDQGRGFGDLTYAQFECSVVVRRI